MKTKQNRLTTLLAKPWLAYVLPFALFMLLTEPARHFPALIPHLYITKTILVGGLLYMWRDKYRTDFSIGLSLSEFLTAVGCGLLVLVIWVVPEELFFQVGTSNGFNPYTLAGTEGGAIALITVRIIGSAMVVPVMEELFWRSFFMRYLVNADFRSVPLGTFSWFSFLGVAVMFGLEHHRIIVGIIAGLLYGLLLVKQKNLKGVIVAHAVTNLGLGLYVVFTEKWMFW